MRKRQHFNQQAQGGRNLEGRERERQLYCLQRSVKLKEVHDLLEDRRREMEREVDEYIMRRNNGLQDGDPRIRDLRMAFLTPQRQDVNQALDIPAFADRR